MKFTVSIVFALLATPVFATCPTKPIKHNWALVSGDQRVSGEYVKKAVSGKKVRYGKEFEHYRKNGGYVYTAGNAKYRADSYVFYKDGSRCINYERPRHDMYVVRDNQLMLITVRGERFVGKITR